MPIVVPSPHVGEGMNAASPELAWVTGLYPRRQTPCICTGMICAMEAT